MASFLASFPNALILADHCLCRPELRDDFFTVLIVQQCDQRIAIRVVCEVIDL